MPRDWPDIVGGGVLAVVGLSAAAFAVMHYEIGSLRRMGPGFFPVALGLGLAGLGAAVALPAMRRPGAEAGGPLEIRVLVAVLASIVIFALGLRHLGLAGTTAACVLVATLPAPRPGWRWRVLLALAVAALTVLVFSVGLRMTLPVWPRLP